MNPANPEDEYTEADQRGEDSFLEAKMVAAGGYAALFQGLESHPEPFEKLTGLDIPGAFAEDWANDLYIDKTAHIAASYSASRGMIKGMDRFDVSYAAKALTVRSVILGLGTYKEFKLDGYVDPMDIAANQFGAEIALYEHRRELRDRYDAEEGESISSAEVRQLLEDERTGAD